LNDAKISCFECALNMAMGEKKILRTEGLMLLKQIK
jgi:hypothetical protein